MSERYVQVGVTALRDPVTGKFLPAVPLFIREEDAKRPEMPRSDGGLMKRNHSGLRNIQSGNTWAKMRSWPRWRKRRPSCRKPV